MTVREKLQALNALYPPGHQIQLGIRSKGETRFYTEASFTALMHNPNLDAVLDRPFTNCGGLYQMDASTTGITFRMD